MNLETVKVEKVEKVENTSSLKIEGATPMMKSENPQENGTKLESQQISLRGKGKQDIYIKMLSPFNRHRIPIISLRSDVVLSDDFVRLGHLILLIKTKIFQSCIRY